MESKILVDFQSSNFYKKLLFDYKFFFILFFLAFIVTFVEKSPKKTIFEEGSVATVLILFTSFFLYTFISKMFFATITIYFVEIVNDGLFLKWTDKNKKYETFVSFDDLKILIKPGGRYSIFLEFNSSNNKSFKKLQQYYDEYWTDKNMRLFIKEISQIRKDCIVYKIAKSLFKIEV